MATDQQQKEGARLSNDDPLIVPGLCWDAATVLWRIFGVVSSVWKKIASFIALLLAAAAYWRGVAPGWVIVGILMLAYAICWGIAAYLRAHALCIFARQTIADRDREIADLRRELAEAKAVPPKSELVIRVQESMQSVKEQACEIVRVKSGYHLT